jgi:hypothetical protein
MSAQTLALASIRGFWPVFIVEWARVRGGALCNSAKRLDGGIDVAATRRSGQSTMFKTTGREEREKNAGETFFQRVCGRRSVLIATRWMCNENSLNVLRDASTMRDT